MQVRIGVQSVAKELVVETSLSAEEVEMALADALGDEAGIFVLKGKNGRVAVPATKLAYIEIGESTPPAVGFSTF